MVLELLIASLVLVLPASAYADFSEIPLYIFADWRYWLFLAVYVLITAKLVQWVRRAAALRDKGRPFPLKSISTASVIVLANALVYQILHHFEHVSQIYQYWYLGQTAALSRGVVFFLDLEWNHFIFDTGYFI